ncbi:MULTISPECIES: bifunctional diaminohydroxyphosphoribosylaminopyrimidine deaminase/5-amino-6-(5-phosphoribosylamino)uracil reductase RibD [Mumia]|uniref:bifunctional diaminohydroxyphosphoribosylaminopyrimidine deaminase/5-amino-6-(5-phosphoribosylamino)uracil reductase RibD n=1 Tax=Mumia TaxID=1546255 RepID=UPI00142179B9|nr:MULTISPECIES: bifunctional diaminohydroxyphosphoribosylaminopyrimidine deaminase/5-amino-6-(5-phosphoribosylamino)uracil reductase RibD [unclassified Mumia]QMW68386.1 bifunctional diaminohydroxyphosphoribosylaminopyrimidine deaminase/5-amino-6-(5-phosphoribosylamino)uracil reductase RibD [Mumia sp. ZJ1417]
MRRALDAAREATENALPNPRVGCVLLAPDGSVLAVGAHRGAGTPHAEVDALSRAGDAARGATAVVTLEPCHHTGRTGPCSEALILAGVARVVYAQDDPNPAAAGGADRLRSAGIEVESGLLATEAEALNVAWTHAVRTGRPYVTWKLAATLDGRSAAADGTSQWITGPDARLDVQRLRARCDAILVGTGTVTADDPRLTLRDDEDAPLPYERQLTRVAMGEREVPEDARVRDAEAPFLHLATRDVDAALATLAAREIRHVWLEGGPRLAGAFLGADRIDEVVAYVAPALLGAGTPALNGSGIETIADTVRLDLTDVTQLGPDLRMTALVRKEGA